MKHTKLKPEIAIILGSGISLPGLRLTDSVTIPFNRLPGLKIPRAAGHTGKWVIGRLNKKPLLIQQGRLHYYEGHSPRILLANIKLMKELGITTLLLTTACGAISKKFRQGNLVLVTDHINLMGFNPLRDLHEPDKYPQFPSMNQVYNRELRQLAEKSAREMKLKINKGILAAVPGPSYETPAETRMLAKLGIDMVSMSTVPAAIYARYLGMNILALACIANPAGKHTSHEHVLATMKKINKNLGKLIYRIIINK